MPNSTIVKILDSFIEQTERSKRIGIGFMQDVQNIYTGGVKAALKAGSVLQDQSKIKLPWMKNAAEIFDVAAPVVMKMQRDCVEAAMNTNLELAKAIRKNLASESDEEK